MSELDVLGAYIRFVLILGAGLFAFSFFVGGILDQFFTEHSPRDYRRARLARARARAEGGLDVEDVSILDLASQLAGRRTRKQEEEKHKEFSNRSYRSFLST